MIFSNKNGLMKNYSFINRWYSNLIILVTAGTAIFLAVKNLFFFDEDIFVAGNNNFMQDVWQRSFIVKLTFIADSFINGKNAVGYHYTNLVLHLVNALLAFLVFKELLKSVANYLNHFNALNRKRRYQHPQIFLTTRHKASKLFKHYDINTHFHILINIC